MVGLAFFLLGLAFYYGAFLFAPVPGWARYAVRPKEGFARRPRQVELWARFRLPFPAYWRLDAFNLPRAGMPGRQRRGFAWGAVGVELATQVWPPKRGVYALPPPVLVLEDVFGLLTRRVELPTEAAELVVYPRRWPALAPALRLTLLGEGPEARGVGLEDPLRYRGARDYRPGDPWRRIHWKLTAKRGEPMVREYAMVRATGVWIFIDTAGAQQVFIEHVAELVASLAVALEAEGLQVGLAWPGGRLPPSAGREGMRRLLTALAELAPSDHPEPPPLPPPGVNLLIFTQHAPIEVVEGALWARARAAKVMLVLFPEGFFLRPGERGRPVWGKTPSMERLLARRRLLAAAGVETRIVRGYEGLTRLQ